MAEQQDKKKKKGMPFEILPNKQVLPLIGMGTYKLKDQQIITNLLRKGLQVGGCKHIDTARYYNNQIPLGKAIKTVISQGRCKREDLIIATKTFNHKDLNPVLEIKQVLKLMQLQYIDIYYLHWPVTDMDPTGKQWTHRPLYQFWKDMEQCVKKGYVKHLGISNFNGQLLVDLLSYAKIKPVVLQIQVHPFLQQQSLIDVAQKNGVIVIAYTPLCRANQLQDQKNVMKDPIIQQLSAKYTKTPAQVVLKTTLYRGVGVIPRTTNPQRLQQNIESWTVQLTQEDMKKVRTIQKSHRVCDGNNLFKHLKIFD